MVSVTSNPTVRYVDNPKARTADHSSFEFIDHAAIAEVREFHRGFPAYQPTPLHSLSSLGRRLNVDRIWVKDESQRFGLNAFKVLGGSYAMGRFIARQLGEKLSDLSFEGLKETTVKERLGDLTFVTATDGNHGRGIAWAAEQLGQKSVVFMPKGSSEARLANIRKEGAQAEITAVNYDDTVRMAVAYAEHNHGVLMQDSAWDGYEEIPTWIMQGYTTLIDEVMEQLEAGGEAYPTHVILQAGVGSFAASMLGYLICRFGQHRPITVIVEPENAACIYKSAAAADGRPHAVTGDLNTIMAGLACGEPSTVAWRILRDFADLYLSCPDSVSATAMRMLGNPLPGDPAIIAGESGAVGLGVLQLARTAPDWAEIGSKLQLDEHSRVLIISTEGDTDPGGYRDIVWQGRHPL